MPTRIKLLLLTLQVFVITGSCAAWAAEFASDQIPGSPAVLTGKKDSLENLIRFPEQEGDISVLMLCKTTAFSNGRLSERGSVGDPWTTNVICASTTETADSERYLTVIADALLEAKVKPAVFNDKDVEVIFRFSVLFEKQDGNENVEVYLHHFQNVDEYGNDYIAAQRLTDKMYYGDICWPSVPVVMEGIVRENGVSINVNSTSEVAESCSEYFVRILQDNMYIPAVYASDFVESRYVEMFTRNRSGLLKLD